MTGGRRPYFTAQLEQAAAGNGVRLRWLSDGWVAELRKDDRVTHVIGYWFPLNNAAAAQLANDKAATYVLLDESGVPAIVHRVLRPGAAPLDEVVAQALTLVPLPLVAKPLAQSSGIDVLRACDGAELRDVLRALMPRYRVLALSPHVPIVREYRVVLLDQRVQLVYEKRRTSDWRHNLHSGAVPELVESAETVSALSTLAQRATAVLNLRFAAVDIVQVRGGLAVLEVNNTISLERFSSHSDAFADLAQRIYRHAVVACFAPVHPVGG